MICDHYKINITGDDFINKMHNEISNAIEKSVYENNIKASYFLTLSKYFGNNDLSKSHYYLNKFFKYYLKLDIKKYKNVEKKQSFIENLPLELSNQEILIQHFDDYYVNFDKCKLNLTYNDYLIIQNNFKSVNKDEGYIYVLKDMKCKSKGEKVFKIGLTTDVLNRIKWYGENVDILFIMKCNHNLYNIEQDILNHFRNIFEQDMGNEYFNGDSDFAILEITKRILENNKLKYNEIFEKKYISMKQSLKNLEENMNQQLNLHYEYVISYMNRYTQNIEKKLDNEEYIKYLFEEPIQNVKYTLEKKNKYNRIKLPCNSNLI